MDCSECGGPLPVLRKPANLRQALWGGWTCPHCGGEFDRWTRRIAPFRAGFASDPAGLEISNEKLARLRPELFGFAGRIHRLKVKVGLEWDQLGYLDEHLANGDSRAAVVVSVSPLVIAAYTDELDGVALLGFPEDFVDDYQLRVGTRLLSVNTYTYLNKPNDDVQLGPKASDQWNGFNPMIAEFLTEDRARVEGLKQKISDDEWQRARRMGEAALKCQPVLIRDGRPVYCGVPATAEIGD